MDDDGSYDTTDWAGWFQRVAEGYIQARTQAQFVTPQQIEQQRIARGLTTTNAPASNINTNTVLLFGALALGVLLLTGRKGA